MPRTGPHTVTVPGGVEAWFALLDRFGTRSFGDLASTAMRYAHDGFVPTARGATRLRTGPPEPHDSAFEQWRAIYEQASAARLFRQPALARTIALVRDHGPDAYYRGPIAADIASHVQSLGGLMSTSDLAAHQGGWVTPLSTTYRGLEVIEMPPNTQGVAALEAVNIVESVTQATDSPTELHHLMVEACKLALLDRDEHVTDPGHMHVSAADLASKAWAAERAARITSQALDPEASLKSDAGTAYMCAGDADGMYVSLIQSNFKGFGSYVTVPGWGINLQNRGWSFSLDPGHVNVVAPRKRPMHTLIPAMALRDGRPRLVFGTMGGHGQAQTHVQLLNRVVDGQLDIQEAINAPRWMLSPDDWTLTMEDRFDPSVVEGLRSRGHRIELTGPYDDTLGHAHAILIEPDGLAAATDLRTEGAALGL